MISDESFPKKEHLLKAGDFRRAYAKGASFKGAYSTLFCIPNNTNQNRIGFSIGARSIKRATDRNKIKRLFREVYRKNRNNMKTGFDLVVTVKRRPGEDLTYNNAENLLIGLIKKAKMLK